MTSAASLCFFFFNVTSTPEIYTLSLHDALPIYAEELKKVIDGALPGVVAGVDGAGGRITIAGTTGQRASARDLIRQFDVNWLRNMSFALFVPERTDARLIVPELDKLINAADADRKSVV